MRNDVARDDARSLGFDTAEWKPDPAAPVAKCDVCGKRTRVRKVAAILMVDHAHYEKGVIWSGQACGVCFGTLNQTMTMSAVGKALEKRAIASSPDGRVEIKKKG